MFSWPSFYLKLSYSFIIATLWAFFFLIEMNKTWSRQMVPNQIGFFIAPPRPMEKWEFFSFCCQGMIVGGIGCVGLVMLNVLVLIPWRIDPPRMSEASGRCYSQTGFGRPS